MIFFDAVRYPLGFLWGGVIGSKSRAVIVKYRLGSDGNQVSLGLDMPHRLIRRTGAAEAAIAMEYAFTVRGMGSGLINQLDLSHRMLSAEFDVLRLALRNERQMLERCGSDLDPVYLRTNRSKSANVVLLHGIIDTVAEATERVRTLGCGP